MKAVLGLYRQWKSYNVEYGRDFEMYVNTTCRPFLLPNSPVFYLLNNSWETVFECVNVKVECVFLLSSFFSSAPIPEQNNIQSFIAEIIYRFNLCFKLRGFNDFNLNLWKFLWNYELSCQNCAELDNLRPTIVMFIQF